MSIFYFIIATLSVVSFFSLDCFLGNFFMLLPLMHDFKCTIFLYGI